MSEEDKNIKFTKLVGVSFNNPDGSSRQKLVKDLVSGEMIFLKREPDNPFDPNSFAVFNSKDQQLGYLKRELASDLVAQSEKGWIYDAYVNEVTGSNKQTTGVNIKLIARRIDCECVKK